MKSILVCGVGAIGSNLAAYLSSDVRDEYAITVLDRDVVEERNLQAGTQFYLRDQVKIPKVEALQYNIHKQYNRTIDIIHGVFMKSENSMIQAFDLLVDAFDNLEARSAITVACRTHSVPCIHIGFGKQFTWSILWNSGYAPPETAVDWDICEISGASSFVHFVAAIGSSVIQEYLTTGKKREFCGNRFSIREIE